MLCDRGYPAFRLFASHREQQRHFCARMPLNFSREVAEFVAGGCKSAVVLFPPQRRCTQTVRALRVVVRADFAAPDPREAEKWRNRGTGDFPA